MSIMTAETYRFSVDEYQKLGEVGIFGEDDRVELLNGNIVLMSPIGIRHAKAVRRMMNLFMRRYGDRCLIDARNPAVIDNYSEPQPDILLVREELDTLDRKPHPQDIFLLVEAADSTLAYDQKEKREAYARNLIVEYWLLDLTEDELVVFRDSDGRDYRSVRRFKRHEEIAPLAFPETTVKVSELLPAVS